MGPFAPMRMCGSPRSTFAFGASDRSDRWPSRVWMMSILRRRAASSTAMQGFTAASRRDTLLPSVSPKPPGSRKSRCMSMIDERGAIHVDRQGCGLRLHEDSGHR